MTFVDNGAPVGYNSDRIIWRKSGNAVPGAEFSRKRNGFSQEKREENLE